MSHRELTDGQYRRLLELRGGCTCWRSAPCGACCDPITDAEAEALGIETAAPAHAAAPQIPPPVWDTRPINPSDAMAAVRAMCGGAR